MTRRPTDAELILLADEIADYAVAFANALTITDHDGRNLLDRCRLEQAGQPRAAAYDGTGGHSSELRLPIQLSRQTGGLILDQAFADLETFARELPRLRAILGTITDAAARHLVRPPRPHEAAQAGDEEAKRDGGCESCSRLLADGGARRWVATFRTSDCRSGSKHATDTARLSSSYRLCQDCYRHVMGYVPAGARLSLDQAIPRRVVKAFAQGKRPKLHEPRAS